MAPDLNARCAVAAASLLLLATGLTGTATARADTPARPSGQAPAARPDEPPRASPRTPRPSSAARPPAAPGRAPHEHPGGPSSGAREAGAPAATGGPGLPARGPWLRPVDTARLESAAPPSPSLAGRQAGEGRLRPGRKPSTASADSGSPAPPRTPRGAAEESAAASPPHSARPSGDATQSAGDRERDGDPPEEPSPATPPAEDKASEDRAPFRTASGPAPGQRPSAGAAARDQGPPGLPGPPARQISPASLGVGLALMGLGIGFLGVRLRRR
ncbi:hypothetical protein ACRAR1_14805 [Streptomyces sanyensis]|uniref:hypothetical protein n=1 Tax=Streptomyces sanyensis TaxID=568869 RepID=UPI003D76BDB0